jgi:Bacterial Ig-like domain (group 2)
MGNFGKLFVALVFCSLSTSLFAQKALVLAPHRPLEPRVSHPRGSQKPAVGRSMVGGFWMVGPDSKAYIDLSNDVAISPIVVTPILYFSTGQRIELPQVKLNASGMSVVSINDALKQMNIVPTTNLYGYVEVQYSWPWDALCVSIKNVDIAHSLIFIYTLEPLQKPKSPAFSPTAALMQDNILEGFWWKQEHGVTGFVALSNVLDKPAHAKVIVTDEGVAPIATHSVTVPAHGTSLVNLDELDTAPGSQGGVRVTYDGPTDGLEINGGLQDPAVGYSARLPLHFPPITTAPHANLSYAALDLMKGAADPMMSFPAGTTFTPYSVVRNISNQPATVTPTVWWMDGIVPHSAPLPGFELLPYHTQTLDLPGLLSKAGLKDYTGSFNLVLDSDGPSRALLDASGSVDQNNTYVFEVASMAMGESVAKSMSYWSTGDGDDTMVTLWNPADEPQDFTFTLFFSGGDGQYSIPIHLNARETHSFNISEIIHSGTPDPAGNVIPPSVHEGRAEIMGSQGENQHILIAIDAGVYNVQKATCGNQYCKTCQGAVNSWILANPFSLSQGGTAQQSFTVQYKTGTEYDHTSVASWASSNTSVATVNAGLVNAVGVGSVTLNALDNNVPDYFYGCFNANPDAVCPMYTGQQGSAPGNVNPTVTISGPSTVLIGTSIQLTATGNPAGGAYSWSSSNSDVTLTNSGSATVTASGASVGTATLTVTYSQNGMNGSASRAVTVQKPTSLSPLASSTPFSCTNMNLNLTYTTLEEQITYTVLDQNLAPIRVSGIPLVEAFTAVSNTCAGVPNTPTPTPGTTDANGVSTQPDNMAMCSASCMPANSSGQPTGACTLQVIQTWNAGGYPVQTKTLTYTCPGPPTLQ